VKLPTFGFVTAHREPLADGVACEAEWMERCATRKRAAAHLWHAPVGLVVPRRYTRLPGWASLHDVWRGDVQERASGGGLVPQGPGLWNLSLVWPAPSALPVDIGGIYTALCDELAAAFARLGLAATPQEVHGSFCDGRYNLAVNGRKLVGTAQAWKRYAGQPVVMAHAVIVVDANPVELTARCNAFEAALGTPTRYTAEALTSVAIEAADPHVEQRALMAIASQFAHIVPPRAA
jgi:lipoate-protein ligase A